MDSNVFGSCEHHGLHTAMIVACLALFAWTDQAKGATVYVASDGTGDFTVVSEALQCASAGDSVLVAPGTYEEEWTTNTVWLDHKPLYFAGLGAHPGETTLTGFRVVFINCDGLIVENLRFYRNLGSVIIGGEESHIAAVRNCIFEGDYGEQACTPLNLSGGIFGLVSVEDCTFLDNSFSYPECGGAAIDADGRVVEIRRCVFLNNSSPLYGAVITSGKEATISDCVFVGNTSANGAAIASKTPTSATTTIERCTFWNNHTTSPGGAIFLQTDSWTMERSIIAGTTNGWGLVSLGLGRAYCCDFWNNDRGPHVGDCYTCTPSYGNIYVDPLFCDPDAGDFRLQPDSPCLTGYHGSYFCYQMGTFGIGCRVVAGEADDDPLPSSELEGVFVRDGLGLGVAPNPTMGPIAFRISLDQPARIRLSIHDVSGREVLFVGEETLDAGLSRYWVDDAYAEGLSAGVYYAVARSGGRRNARAFVLLEH